MTVIAATPDEAVGGIPDGASVLIGGFGSAGQPVELIDALRRAGPSNLTVISNNAGNGDNGLAALLAAGQVRRIVCSFPRQSDSWVFDRLYRDGAIELEVVPQGNLAERIRAAGAGIGGFYTPTGVGTLLAEGKEQRTINGRDYILELPLHADFALIKAHRADTAGNLVYRKTARNFGPIMAAAATTTIAQVGEIVAPGDIDPETVITPGIFVKRLVRCAPPQHPRQRRTSSVTTPTITPVEHLDRKPLSRNEIAATVARDIPAGAVVNLGIGLPTTVSDHLPADSGVILHTENGMLGMGPAATGSQIDPDLINAGKLPVTELPGASYFDQAASFAIMRGGHLDVCVLGAFQVSRNGDLANWHTGEPDAIPAVGGAIDLAIGAKDVFVMMSLFTKDGQPKLVPHCTYPVTGLGCVSRIYTDHAVFLITEAGIRVRETYGITVDELQTRLDVRILDGP